MIALILKFFGSKIGGAIGVISIVGLLIAGTATLYYRSKTLRLETQNVMLTQNLTVANLTIDQSNADKVAIIASLDAYIKANTEMEKEHAAESETLRKANDRKTVENIELKNKLAQNQKDLDDLTATFANLKPGEDPEPLKLKIKEMQEAIDQLQETIKSADCLKVKVPYEVFYWP